MALKIIGYICVAVALRPGVAFGGQQNRPGYVLGPDDLISIRLVQAPEIAEKVRIDNDGFIELPFVGRVKAVGLSLESLRAELTKRYTTIVREPELLVSIEDFRSQPVSVIGAVNTPGVQQLRGSKTLAEVIALAGGLRSDGGSTINITRRTMYGRLPLPGAHDDPSGEYSLATINVRSLMEARDPAVNIPVQTNDVISVPRAEMVYVVGDVQRAGGFVLNDKKSMSVLEALAMAGGPNRTALAEKAKILRASAVAGQGREEVPVNIKGIMGGKAGGLDLELGPDDILFIPDSTGKRLAVRALEAAIQLGTGVAVYRR